MLSLLELCRRCWAQKSIPQSWATASVVLFFKKGDKTLLENYRPISLMCIVACGVQGVGLDAAEEAAE